MKILIAHWNHLSPNTNSGDLRLLRICKVLLAVGHNVTFMQPERLDNEHLSNMGIQSMFSIGSALRHPRLFLVYLLLNRFDLAILAPHSTFNALSWPIRQALPNCRLVLDTIDLFHIRLRRKAILTGREADVAAAKASEVSELKAVDAADAVWVVSEIEREILNLRAKRVSVIPNIHERIVCERTFSQRNGIIFLGNYLHAPNVDAVQYFVSDIFKTIRSRLPEVVFNVVGSNAQPEILALATIPGVRVVGYVDDIHQLLGTMRVAVAPLRYGAGTKGKVGEYLSCGLACVSTSVGAEGMGLKDGQNILVRDEALSFADAVVEAYTNEDLWNQLSRAGPLHIETHLSVDVSAERIVQALNDAVSEST